MSKENDDLLKEMRERHKRAIDAEHDNRTEALDDLKFLQGGDNQWPEQAARQRKVEGRPCLSINKLPTFIHQVTNDQLQNKTAIKVHPVDDNADVETAKVIQGLIRHIEYSSNADVATDTAVNSAARIGFGYFRLVTDFCAPDSFDQDILYKRIPNPFTVYLDPAGIEPDGSDIKWAIITEQMLKDDFKSEYPNAEAASISEHGVGDLGKEWVSSDSVRVVEYYRIESTPAELVLLSNGESGYKDDLIELPPGVTIVKTRQSVRKKVMWYKCTAVDVLESAEIPCDWIPVFPVYGEELNVDGKVLRSGMIRNAKDPARMYNYWMTSATEEISLRPKTPYIGAEGQFEGHEAQWRDANNRSFSYLEYKPVTLAGSLAPAPQRQPMADVPTGVLAMAMHANDDIKATTGIFDASLGARGNETSGRAITARQKEGDVANFHFADSLNITIRHVGRCLLSMIPRIYDSQRVIRILGEDETAEHIEINAPNPEAQQGHEVDEQGKAIKTVLNDLTVGKYDVTISSGPSYSTLRQEAADAMVSFGQSWPKLMDIAGDKVVKAMDWPGADEIAERIAKTIDPKLIGDGKEELPPAVAQHLQSMNQYSQQLEQQLEQMQAALKEAEQGNQAKYELEQLKQETALRIAEINAESRGDVEELKGMVAMLIAKMPPPPQLVADVNEDLAEDEAPEMGLSSYGGDDSHEWARPMQPPEQEPTPYPEITQFPSQPDTLE